MFEESLILLKESISIQLVDSPKVIRLMPLFLSVYTHKNVVFTEGRHVHRLQATRINLRLTRLMHTCD